jgi:ketosteroid isomerase-like protein
MNQNQDLIQSFYEILNSKDITPLRNKLANESEFLFPLSLPYGGVFKGIEQVMDSLTMVFTYLGVTKFNVINYMFDGDSTVCTGTFIIEFWGFAFVDIFTVKDGKILKRIHFVDSALILDNFKTNFIE